MNIVIRQVYENWYALIVNGHHVWTGTRDDCIHNMRQLFK
jgi:hypothetical protein